MAVTCSCRAYDHRWATKVVSAAPRTTPVSARAINSSTRVKPDALWGHIPALSTTYWANRVGSVTAWVCALDCHETVTVTVFIPAAGVCGLTDVTRWYWPELAMAPYC